MLVGLWLASNALGCSCSRSFVSDLEHCEGSPRAFAATVEGYDWPLLHELPVSRVGVTLSVQTVWAGEVPAIVTTETGFGGGDCGVHPPPGTRIVVCDRGTHPPSLSWCSQPAMGGEALALGEALGPGRPPTDPSPGAWAERFAALRTTAERQVLLGFPVAAFAVGAVGGGRAARRWPSPGERFDRRPWLALVCLAALALGARVVAAGTWELWPWIQVLLVAVSVVSAGLAWHGQRAAQRYGGRVGGLLVAVVGSLGFGSACLGRLHLPVQRPDAVPCSLERARDFLRTLPSEPADAEARESWERAIRATVPPRSCVDFGLTHLEVDIWPGLGPVIQFPDGQGGGWTVLGSGEGAHGWEPPW